MGFPGLGPQGQPLVLRISNRNRSWRMWVSFSAQRRLRYWKTSSERRVVTGFAGEVTSLGVRPLLPLRVNGRLWSP